MKKCSDEQLIQEIKAQMQLIKADLETCPEFVENIEELIVRFGITHDVVMYQNEELNDMRTGQYKDKELARLKRDLDKLEARQYREFGISEKEYQDAQFFLKKHFKEKHPGENAPECEFCFRKWAGGVGLRILCPECGEALNHRVF